MVVSNFLRSLLIQQRDNLEYHRYFVWVQFPIPDIYQTTDYKRYDNQDLPVAAKNMMYLYFP